MARFSIAAAAVLSLCVTACVDTTSAPDAPRRANEATLSHLFSASDDADERVVVLHENQGLFLATGEVVDVDPYAKTHFTDVYLARGRCSFRLHHGVCGVEGEAPLGLYTDDECSTATSYAIGSPNVSEPTYNQAQGAVLLLQAKDGLRYRAELLEDIASQEGFEVTLLIQPIEDGVDAE